MHILPLCRSTFLYLFLLLEFLNVSGIIKIISPMVWIELLHNYYLVTFFQASRLPLFTNDESNQDVL